MTDEPTTQAETDIDLLLNACVEYASRSLDERGGFPPIAVALGTEVTDEEEVSLFEPDPEPEGEEQAQEAIEGLEQHLRDNLHLYRAAALAFDVSGEDEEWDAITVLISHSDGTTVDIQLPYNDGEFGEISTFVGTLELYR